MHAAEAVSSPLSTISLGDVGGDGGVRPIELQRGTCRLSELTNSLLLSSPPIASRARLCKNRYHLRIKVNFSSR